MKNINLLFEEDGISVVNIVGDGTYKADKTALFIGTHMHMSTTGLNDHRLLVLAEDIVEEKKLENAA
ncbi:MAG: hypothetical protein GQ570_03755 [Helicobacteraceae bacterium]|nr:hypothetical protein [Helicobacteraceae bacterium]